MSNKPSRATFHIRLNEFVTILRNEIVAGKWGLGEFLPSEKTFAKQYELSNQSVRKGLEVLVDEGLIVKIPRVGNKVNHHEEVKKISLKLGFHNSVPLEADIDRILASFHREYPHIQVEMIPLPDHNNKMTMKYMDSGMLDIVTMNYNEFQGYLENNNLHYLQPYEYNPEIYAFLNDSFTVEDQLYVMPFIYSPVILCYNREHFQERQVPKPDSSWQWDEFIEHANKLTIPNERLGFYYHFNSPNRWTVFLLQRGGVFERQSKGDLRLKGTQMEEAFRFCRQMRSYIPSLEYAGKAGSAENLLAQGKASMIMTSYFHLNHLRGADVAFDLAPVPHFGDPRTLLMCIGLAVNSRSPYKEAALLLAKFLTSYRAQLMIRKHTYSIPALKAAADWSGTEKMYRPPRFALFREIIPSFRLFTDLHINYKELSMIHREAEFYWAGLESDEEFFTRVERVSNS